MPISECHSRPLSARLTLVKKPTRIVICGNFQVIETDVTGQKKDVAREPGPESRNCSAAMSNESLDDTMTGEDKANLALRKDGKS